MVVDLWKTIRVPLLVLTFGGVFITFAKVILNPVAEKVEIQSVVLPMSVPLPNWQSIDSKALNQPLGTQYQYRQGDLNLEIELRYVDHPHDNEKLFREYDPTISPNAKDKGTTIHQQQNLGSYSLSQEKDRAYLRSCINPRGPAAITYEQFIKNRYTYDLKASRFLPVLLGQEPLRDHRCLWVYLSVPIDSTSPDSSYAVLEEVWRSWYLWWHPRFPKL
ncbi:MAG: cyanoexosortase A system-associated protein [Microcoleaceae cyanobacterium]